MQFTTKLIPLAIAIAFAGSASAQEVVRIGHVGPISGASAHLGKDNENGAKMAVEELNAKGFTLGGKKVKLELLLEDDGADPKQGTAVAQKLVDAKVHGVIGHLNSGTTVPASKIYHDAGIPQISPSATTPQYTKQGFKSAFRVVANDNKLGGTLGAYAVDTLKAKNIAVIDDRSAYGQGVADEFVKGAKKKFPGVKIVGKEFTNPNATDFTAILTSIKAKKPDLIFFGGMDAVGGPMLKQARELGIKSAFTFGDGACTEEMAKLAGNAAEGMVCSQAGLPKEAASKEFVDAFKAKYGEIKQYAPYFYDATNAVIEAMKKANSADPAKFAPEIFNVSFQGATGMVEFDAKGDRKGAEVTIFRLQGGKIVPVAIVKEGKSTPFKAEAPAAAAEPKKEEPKK